MGICLLDFGTIANAAGLVVRLGESHPIRERW